MAVVATRDVRLIAEAHVVAHLRHLGSIRTALPRPGSSYGMLSVRDAMFSRQPGRVGRITT